MDGISPSTNISPLLAANVSVVAAFVEESGVCVKRAISGTQQRLACGKTTYMRVRELTRSEFHFKSNQRGIPQIIVTAPVNPPSLRQRETMSPNHLTVSAQPFSLSTPPRQTSMMAYRPAQCTHLTMVRLYTSELRCSVCFRVPSMGWFYRCSQDRELLLEQGAELGIHEQIDSIGNVFDPPTGPRPRSPAARADKLAFFNEIDDDALKTYSPAQLSMILKQRAHVLEVARTQSEVRSARQPSYYNSQSLLTSRQGTQAPIAPMNQAGPYMKPWTPQKGEECQFKCCHFCRPSLQERAWLSIDAIANADIPLTAVHGFGLHASDLKQRHVSDVNVVKNLGLRKPSAPGQASSAIRPDLYSSQAPQGLRILVPRPEYPLPVERSLGSVMFPIHADAFLQPLTPHDHPLRHFPSFHPSPPTGFDRPMQVQPSLPISAANSYITPSINPINQDAHNSFYDPRPTSLQRMLENASANARLETALLIPLPAQTEEELKSVSAPLTSMEVSELGNRFGEQPLDVADGVAVNEEGFELYLADLIKQF